MTVNPFRDLSMETVEAVISDYQTRTLSTRDIVRRTGVGKDRMMVIIRANNIEERGRSKHHGIFSRGRSRPSTLPAPIDDVALERAKLTLRKRGCIVFAAEVTDGWRSKGLFRCDGKLWTRQKLMEAAAK